MQGRVVSITEGTDDRRVALVVWEYSLVRDGLKVDEQFVGVSILKEESAFTRNHGLGKSAGAAAKDGNSAKDGFGCNETERLRPERRRNKSPGVGEPGVDGRA
jgi:hypothetical protein